MSLASLRFGTRYDFITVEAELARLLGAGDDQQVLRRTYWSEDPLSGYRVSWSQSYILRDLLAPNPDLLDSSKEPWPGGTLHQLSTVGIEIVHVVDEVTGRMPTTVEAQQWGLDDGVPLLNVRRISSDDEGQVIEVSDASYPADRTLLRFLTALKKWNEA